MTLTWVVLSEVDEVVQPEHAHPTEVGGGVVALEAEAHPLGGHALRQRHAREAALPQPAQKLLVRLVGAAVRRALERVQRREIAEASLRRRVADAEEALRVARSSADTLSADYAAALETAERERAEALQARDEARAAAAAGDSELTRARTMRLVAEATARDAAAQRRAPVSFA